MSPTELNEMHQIKVRLDKLEGHSQHHSKEFSELRNDVDTILIKSGQMHTALIGNEYIKKGGLISRMDTMECKVSALAKWKTRITAIFATISTLLTSFAAYFQFFKK
jgi:hypothetical protein